MVILISGDSASAEQNPADASATLTLNAFPDQHLSFSLGGLLQTDYRYYTDPERSDDRFLIRRAQLELTGTLDSWFTVNLEYEFKNDVDDHLLDTYAEIDLGMGDSSQLRIGHFKKPFGLEFQNSESSIYFAERSMGYFLSPGRDVGVMLKGACLGNRLIYAGGLFNAEGENVTNRSNSNDAPEIIGRLVLAPFERSPESDAPYFHFGISGAFAKINLGNLDFKVKTTGMVETSRNIYVLSHDTKFGVLQDADSRWRAAAEAAFAWNSLAFQGEYFHLTYTNLQPVTLPEKDAVFSTWYVSALYFLTGETPTFKNGTLCPIAPLKKFSRKSDGFGAIALGLRYDHFTGDEDWINPAANVSVRDADSLTLSLNWIPASMQRIMMDYTYTDLSDPIRIRVKPDGSVDYIDSESIITLRYAFDF